MAEDKKPKTKTVTVRQGAAVFVLKDAPKTEDKK